MRLLCTVALLSVSVSALAQPSSPACPAGTRADYHVHVKGDLSLEEALRRSRESGITYGIAINGGLGFPIESDAGLEAFLLEMRGRPVFKAFQGEGREWVRLFSRTTLEKFDYVFTDAMTWSDSHGTRMRLWIQDEVGLIADPERFMDLLVDRATAILATEPIDIYVNATYIPDQLSAQYDALWTPARMKRIVDGLAANGIAMEINNRRRIPSAAFIRMARQAGVKMACGTNNAGAADLGRNQYLRGGNPDPRPSPGGLLVPACRGPQGGAAQATGTVTGLHARDGPAHPRAGPLVAALRRCDTAWSARTRCA